MKSHYLAPWCVLLAGSRSKNITFTTRRGYSLGLVRCGKPLKPIGNPVYGALTRLTRWARSQKPNARDSFRVGPPKNYWIGVKCVGLAGSRSKKMSGKGLLAETRSVLETQLPITPLPITQLFSYPLPNCPMTQLANYSNYPRTQLPNGGMCLVHELRNLQRLTYWLEWVCGICKRDVPI